jgi:hypothetical protein
VTQVLQGPEQEVPAVLHGAREHTGQHGRVAPDLVHAGEQAQHDDAVPLDGVRVDSRVGRAERLDVQRERARIEEAPRPMDASRNLASGPPQLRQAARAGAERGADAALQLLEDPLGSVDARRHQRPHRGGLGARPVQAERVEIGRTDRCWWLGGDDGDGGGNEQAHRLEDVDQRW